MFEHKQVHVMNDNSDKGNATTVTSSRPRITLKRTETSILCARAIDVDIMYSKCMNSIEKQQNHEGRTNCMLERKLLMSCLQ